LDTTVSCALPETVPYAVYMLLDSTAKSMRNNRGFSSCRTLCVSESLQLETAIVISSVKPYLSSNGFLVFILVIRFSTSTKFAWWLTRYSLLHDMLHSGSVFGIHGHKTNQANKVLLTFPLVALTLIGLTTCSCRGYSAKHVRAQGGEKCGKKTG